MENRLNLGCYIYALHFICTILFPLIICSNLFISCSRDVQANITYILQPSLVPYSTVPCSQSRRYSMPGSIMTHKARSLAYVRVRSSWPRQISPATNVQDKLRQIPKFTLLCPICEAQSPMQCRFIWCPSAPQHSQCLLVLSSGSSGLSCAPLLAFPWNIWPKSRRLTNANIYWPTPARTYPCSRTCAFKLLDFLRALWPGGAILFESVYDIIGIKAGEELVSSYPALLAGGSVGSDWAAVRGLLGRRLGRWWKPAHCKE